VNQRPITFGDPISKGIKARQNRVCPSGSSGGGLHSLIREAGNGAGTWVNRIHGNDNATNIGRLQQRAQGMLQ
jgi:hypothetical protein